MPNRLAAERSPYLLQHANNPVDWYPWGQEAFARARAEDRPIFLSIGYATCHWCHVMERESFENEAIASLLNDAFVSIKVDREERPDVDRVYMTFVQATTGSGGWPMSVFLTPDLKPFFGGTYFPPDSRWGRPGFADVLREISHVWRAERSRVNAIADALTERLREATSEATGGAAELPEPSVLDAGVDQFRRIFDSRHGGFGGAPKFPRPSELLFLLREHARTGRDEALEMAVQTLRAMAFGGMRDHVGGGFHRYSVDREWHVPHFEKMLYDQAQLAIAYLEAAQATGDPFFSVVAEDTLDYVRRDLTGEYGAFFSAEDADSVPPESAGDPSAHRSEGAFYLWTRDEIVALLGDESNVVTERFGILPGGNAPEDPQGEFAGTNILYTAATVEQVAQRTGRTEEEVVSILGRARPALFDARARRPRPLLDDKVLTAWNGLTIAAFARAGRVLVASDRAPMHVETATRAARFVRTHLWQPDRRLLLRRHREGESAIEGYCEDYAYLIWGLLELFQATGDAEWLAWALELQDRQDELFWDAAEGGWFNTTGADSTVLLRLKEDYDGAEPSPISVGAQNLLWLSHLTGSDDRRRRAAQALARLRLRGPEAARISPFACAVLSTWYASMGQVVVVGEPGREETRHLHGLVAQRYLPFTIVIPVIPGEHQQRLGELLPAVAGMQTRDGQAAAYVCRDFVCDTPVTDPAALASALGSRS